MPRGRFLLHASTLAGLTAVEADSDRSFPRHVHDGFGLGVVERGAQNSASGRGRVEASAGDVITVNPGEVHDGRPLGASGRAWKMLYLTPAVVADLAADVGEGSDRAFEFEHPVLHDPGLGRRVAALFAAATAPEDAIAAEERLLALVHRLAHPRSNRCEPIPPAIRLARARIDDDPAAPLTLADLARLSGLGRFPLVRGFVRATGLPPHAYLLQRRIERARTLILAGTPLAEAAVAAGFADQSHMTRLFTRTFGLSPGAFAAAGPGRHR